MMPSSIGSIRFFPSIFCADTCNIDESAPFLNKGRLRQATAILRSRFPLETLCCSCSRAAVGRTITGSKLVRLPYKKLQYKQSTVEHRTVRICVTDGAKLLIHHRINCMLSCDVYNQPLSLKTLFFYQNVCVLFYTRELKLTFLIR